MATFFNQATLSYSGGTVNSNITSGEILEVLSATKTAVVETYSQGDTITYVINIVNSGNTPFSGITVTDNLGAYTSGTAEVVPLNYISDSVKFFSNGVLQLTPVVTAGSSLEISGISVPTNGVSTIIYAARTNNFTPPSEDGAIENTAVISGEGITDIIVTETVTSEAEPRLSITKSLTPSTVTENSRITYTFVIQNTGNTAAVGTNNVIITDTFNPALSDISVAYNGTTWNSPTNYTYNEATGLFTTTLGSITVPAATFSQNPTNGEWIIEPGVTTISVTGTI